MGEAKRRKLNGEDKDRKKKFGEIFTPMKLVNEMLDKFPKESWTDPNKTFLDPCVGNGNFIAGILPRLMTSLSSFEPDPVKLHKWIFEHMLHGVDIQPALIEECIHRFDLYDVKHHFVCADALTYPMNFIEWDLVDMAKIPNVNFFQYAASKGEVERMDFTDIDSKFLAMPTSCIMARNIKPLW